jgi:hypothetical protein
MTAIRDKARKILSVVPEYPGQINSSTDGGKTDNKAFTDITNTPHSTMAANWKTGGIMTACNGFVGWYASTLGSKFDLGRFDVEQRLKGYGKAHSWVKSTKDRRPKYGDICRYTKFHIGVSLDFDGDRWNHVDAGQGGKKSGFDIVKRGYENPYDWTYLQGWIDIDLFFADDATASTTDTAVPEWLTTWWKVTGREDAYYVFDKDHQVKRTRRSPLVASQGPIGDTEAGTFTIGSDGMVLTTWPHGKNEKFSKAIGSIYEDRMKGTNAAYEKLTAVTLF